MNYLSALRRQMGLGKSVETTGVGVDPMNASQSKTIVPIDRHVEVETPVPLSPEQTSSVYSKQHEQETPQTNAIDHEPAELQSKLPLSGHHDALKDQLTHSTINTSDHADSDLTLSSRPDSVKPIDEFHQTVTPPIETVGEPGDLSRPDQEHSSPVQNKSLKTAINAVEEIHVHQDVKPSIGIINSSKFDAEKKILPIISDLPSEKKARVMHVFDEVKQWVNEAPTEAEPVGASDIAQHDWIEPLSTEDHHQVKNITLNQSPKTRTPHKSSDHMVQDYNLSIGNIDIEIEAPATTVEPRQPASARATTPKASFLNWQRHYIHFE